MSISTDFEEVYDELRKIVSGVEISVTSLTLIVMKTMRLVETVTQNTRESGAAKKELALRLIGRLLHEIPMDEDTRRNVVDTFHAIGPSIIDGLAQASNSQFLKNTKSWLHRLCKCPSKSAAAPAPVAAASPSIASPSIASPSSEAASPPSVVAVATSATKVASAAVN